MTELTIFESKHFSICNFFDWKDVGLGFEVKHIPHNDFKVGLTIRILWIDLWIRFGRRKSMAELQDLHCNPPKSMFW